MSPSGEPLDLDFYPVPPPGGSTEAQGAPSLGSNDGSSRNSTLRDASDSALSGLQNVGRLLEDDALAALEHAQKEKLVKPQASGDHTEDLRSILSEGETDDSSMDWAERGPLLARVGQAPGWLIALLLVSVATLGALGYRSLAAFQRRREERQGG